MPATPASEADETGTPALQEQPPPACVMSFNASDATGAGGIAGDIATIAAMGAHALPVVTSIVLRDTAEIFEHSTLDPLVAEVARELRSAAALYPDEPAQGERPRRRRNDAP